MVKQVVSGTNRLFVVGGRGFGAGGGSRRLGANRELPDKKTLCGRLRLLADAHPPPI